MKLKKLIENLQKLQDQGHGDRRVVACDGASGEYRDVGSAHATAEQGDQGPFSVEPGETYISLYVGN